MQRLGMVFILVLASCEGGWSASDLAGPQSSQPLQSDPTPLGPQGLKSNVGRQERQERQSSQRPQSVIGAQNVTASLGPWDTMPGGSASNAGASCRALLEAGVTVSGVYWVINPTPADPSQAGWPVRVYCDQDINGGGWALVYNSVLGAATLDFWNIPHAQRLGRRGRPSLDSNFYDGSLYQTGSVTYMDVIEDLQGRTAIAFVARSTGINNWNMRFSNPALVSGNSGLFTCQFAAGWSAPDYDGDDHPGGSCATYANNVTQHYCGCWGYNLGSDADNSGGDGTDQRLGPHVLGSVLTSLGFSGDGSAYSRVREIRRYVWW